MKKTIITILSTIAFFSCKKEVIDTKPIEKQEIVINYADLGFAMYSDAVAKAKELKTAIDDFVSAPSQSKLEACKLAWQNARVPYAQAEAYRFYGGPIDNSDNGREAYINAWPLDEAFMDYTTTSSVSGIINNIALYPSITKDKLSELNQSGSEENVCTGYHAIEFLLWGQDLNPSGPGARPYTDFVDGGTATNQSRRRSFLVAVTDLLIADLQSVADQWDKSKTGNYRSSFVSSAELNNSLAKILIGLGKYTKGEMSGERISVSYQNSDQEDEHDCFSDYTMIDIRNWQIGLKGIYTGTYTQSNGTKLAGASLSSYLKKYNPETDKNIISKFEATDATLASITTTFDQAIISTNADYSKIATLISNLRTQADSYADIISGLGVINEYNGLNTEE